MPVFRMAGKPIAGFSAAKKWISYLPHSGVVITTLTDELSGFEVSKGAVKMPTDTPLPIELIRRLIEARRSEIDV